MKTQFETPAPVKTSFAEINRVRLSKDFAELRRIVDGES